jgi:hypothetical protein
LEHLTGGEPVVRIPTLLDACAFASIRDHIPVTS